MVPYVITIKKAESEAYSGENDATEQTGSHLLKHETKEDTNSTVQK